MNATWTVSQPAPNLIIAVKKVLISNPGVFFSVRDLCIRTGESFADVQEVVRDHSGPERVAGGKVASFTRYGRHVFCTIDKVS